MDVKKNENTGSKDRQREDNEDRSLVYRKWRWGNGPGYVTDADQVEFRYKNGEIVVVAVLELTRYDGLCPVDKIPTTYLNKIIERYNNQAQGSIAKHIAEKLGAKAWIVVYDKFMSGFQIYNLTNGRGWHYLTPEKYVKWLEADCGLDGGTNGTS